MIPFAPIYESAPTMSECRARPRAATAWLALLLATTAGAAPAATPGHYAERPEVRAFIAELAQDDGFDARALRRLFAHARYQAKVIVAISRPVQSPPKWYEYAPRFLDSDRVAAGRAFWHEHAAALARAQELLGVPQELIVAILGVETYYGRNVGSYPVFDALTTLAFDYPRRADFFRGELKEFLLWAREQGISPLVPRGSYAGAIGPAQFMPGSIRAYGIDFNGDGGVDLEGDIDDAIGSVAHYLSDHGWVRGQPVMEPARIDSEEAQAGIIGQLDEGITATPEPRRLGARRRNRLHHRRRSGERSGGPAHARGARRAELLAGVQQLVRAHALQPQPAVCVGGLAARAGAQRRSRNVAKPARRFSALERAATACARARADPASRRRRDPDRCPRAAPPRADRPAPCRARRPIDRTS